MTLDLIPRGTHTLITVTPQECKLTLDYIMDELSLMFQSIDQDLSIKTMGYLIIKEPSVKF